MFTPTALANRSLRPVTINSMVFPLGSAEKEKKAYNIAKHLGVALPVIMYEGHTHQKV